MFKKLVIVISSNPYILIMVILLSACAPQKNQLPPPTVTTIPIETSDHIGDMSWWACRFKISWDSDVQVDWAVDLLLAHAVVKPVLKEHAKNLFRWRFHRRAVRDKVGHQFSFLFYADSGVASKVMEEIKQSDILQKALEEKVVEKTIFSDPAKARSPPNRSHERPSLVADAAKELAIIYYGGMRPLAWSYRRPNGQCHHTELKCIWASGILSSG
jgi:hypothetical protein